MSIALVGSAGSLASGGTNSSVTPSWGAGQTRTAGNLLICVALLFGDGNTPATPAGWSSGAGTTGGASGAAVFYKIAAGGDAAPTFAADLFGRWYVWVNEYSGNASVAPLDQHGVFNGSFISGPKTVTAGGTDSAAGDLVVMAATINFNGANTTSVTHTPNNGVTPTQINNNGVNTTDHYGTAWGVTTGNSGADSDAVSFGAGVQGASLVLASFKASGASSSTRTASESVSVSGSARIASARSRSAADSISASSVAALTSARSRSAADSISTSSAAAVKSAHGRTTAESVGVSSAAAVKSAHGRTSAESISVSSAASGATARPRTAASSISVSSSASVVSAHSRTAGDTVSVSSSARLPVPYSRTASQAVSVSSVAALSGAQARTCASTITLSSVARRSPIARSRNCHDTLVVSSMATPGRARTCHDSIVTSSRVKRTKGHVRHPAPPTGGDVIAISSAATVKSVKHRTTADHVTVASTASRGGLSRARRCASTVTTSSSARRAVAGHSRTAAQTVVVSDQIVRGPQRFAVTTIAVHGQATRSGTIARSRSVAATITVSEGATVVVERFGRVSASITVSDQAVRALRTIGRTAATAITVHEHAARSVEAYRRTIVESWLVIEGVAMVGRHPRSVGDSIAVSEHATRAVRGSVRRAATTIAVSERVTWLYRRAVADAIAVSSAVELGGKGWFSTASTTIAVSSQATRAARGSGRRAATTITLHEHMAHSATDTRSVTVSITISERVGPIIARFLRATQAVAVTSAVVTGASALRRSVRESISVSMGIIDRFTIHPGSFSANATARVPFGSNAQPRASLSSDTETEQAATAVLTGSIQ